ncbi:MAG TPA: LLM class flavin-dependent oxidoreductase [Gemmatimonadales bacterium]|jgi:alkanesulfonate monooxygenase SsuD/methylene tetrahydromethanopterin reductase-like flavin-dependent oxidoreductase (luciferase family)|nr:LLM class flavin-dependent oxidoreductase [Gemmatimonadales bacterium]
MFISLQHPRPWSENDERRLLDDALRQVELGDRLGVDYVWAQEHHFLEEYSHSSAPEVFLAACSQRTSRIRLGHGIAVMSPYFNAAARVAERIATLDLISGGRVEWGTGESGSRMELEGFGVSFVDKRPMWAEAVRECARMQCLDPYPGYQGKYFSMPARNVVPKPLQKPHPPLWAACSNRDSLKLAARLGMGALTFAFTDAREASFWVEEYYETFRSECTPIGLAVNPNVAMLTGFMCHEDEAVARSRGDAGAQFFAFSLGHYWRDGIHVPGRTDLWKEFIQRPDDHAEAVSRERMKAGMEGIGSPAQLIDNFRAYEEAGVDQLILLHQCGGYRQEHVSASLELFANRVLPEFKQRDGAREEKKRRELAPFIAAALDRIPALDVPAELPGVAAYPRLWAEKGAGTEALAPDRRPGMAALWQLQVGGHDASHGADR